MSPNTKSALAVATLGTGMVYLDQSAMNIALPAIQGAFRGELADLQWIIGAYMLILISLLLVGGILADRYGRVKVYTAGIVLFGVGSVLAGLSGNAYILIAARGVQGIGVTSLISDLYIAYHITNSKPAM